MKNLLTILIFICLISACSTLPPPYIDNGVYINPKYEYSIKIPQGWIQDNKAKILKALEGKSKVAFLNKQTKGSIAIIIDKKFPSLRYLSNDKIEEIKEGFEKGFKPGLEEIKKLPNFINISYEIYSFSYCIEPCLFLSMEMEFEEIKVKNHGFNYSCQNDDTCTLSIFLYSSSDTYEENKETFKDMLKSLEKYKFISKEQ